MSREELAVWMKTNRTWRKYWDDLTPLLTSANRRGVTRWVFALGYIAGQMSVRESLEKTPMEVEKALKPVLRELENLAHLRRVE